MTQGWEKGKLLWAVTVGDMEDPSWGVTRITYTVRKVVAPSPKNRKLKCAERNRVLVLKSQMNRTHVGHGFPHPQQGIPPIQGRITGIWGLELLLWCSSTIPGQGRHTRLLRSLCVVCVSCMWSVPHVAQVSPEKRRGCQISRTQSYRWLQCPCECLKLNLSPLHKQEVLRQQSSPRPIEVWKQNNWCMYIQECEGRFMHVVWNGREYISRWFILWWKNFTCFCFCSL